MPYSKKYYYGIFLEDVRQEIFKTAVERMQQMDFMDRD
jgi:hypothetical protein